MDGQGCKAVGARNVAAALALPLEVPGRLLNEVAHGVRVFLLVVRDVGVALIASRPRGAGASSEAHVAVLPRAPSGRGTQRPPPLPRQPSSLISVP